MTTYSQPAASNRRPPLQTKPIAPSKKVQQQIERKLAAKQRLMGFFGQYLEKEYDAELLWNLLRFAEPSYALFAEPREAKHIDRTGSLIGCHLFVSAKHPQPFSLDSAVDGTERAVGLLPILQLNMAWVNAVCNRDFDPCLLQLWLHPEQPGKDCLRRIPLEDLEDVVTDGVVDDPSLLEQRYRWLADENRAFEHLVELPNGSAADSQSLQLVQCKPIGVTHPDVGDHLFEMLKEGDMSGLITDEVLKDLKQFADDDSIHGQSSVLVDAMNLFGSFTCSSGRSESEFEGDGALFSLGRGSRVDCVVTYKLRPDASPGTDYLLNALA